MELWNRLAKLMLRLIDDYDDQAIFLWLLIEETGFPLPLPGDMAMLLAGYRVAQGKMNAIWALLLLELASMLGASVLYWLGARGGRPLLHRYGRYIRLDRAKLDRAESWLHRRQVVAIVAGRIVPGLRGRRRWQIDPIVNLAAQPRNLPPAGWIVPLSEPLPPGQVNSPRLIHQRKATGLSFASASDHRQLSYGVCYSRS